MEDEMMPQATMSNSIAAIAKALVQAQKNMPIVEKSSSNPFFRSKYADLAAIWSAIRKPLTDAGLAISQTIDPSTDTAKVETYLIHESGEWIKSILWIKPVKGDPQGMGSALAYARRYALSAIVGVACADEDDDGNAASAPGAKPEVRGKPEVEMPKTKKKTLTVAEAYSYPCNVLFDLEAKFTNSEYEEIEKSGKKSWVTHVSATSGAVPITVTLWGKYAGAKIEPGQAICFQGAKALQVGGQRKFMADSVVRVAEEGK